MTPECRRCGVELTDENWYPSSQKVNDCLCAECNRKQSKKWRDNNPEKIKAMSMKYRQMIRVTKDELSPDESITYTLSCMIPIGDSKKIDALIESGMYLNRSDVLRTALRNLIRECGV